MARLLLVLLDLDLDLGLDLASRLQMPAMTSDRICPVSSLTSAE